MESPGSLPPPPPPPPPGWRLLLPALLSSLLLLRTAAAPAQGSSKSRHDCPHGILVYYNEAVQKCCQPCPSGYQPKTACPTDVSSGCEKTRCESGFYLSRKTKEYHCEACVTCRPDRQLVEKSPCTPDSDRVCECQPGWYCRMTLANTCNRCAPHSTCKPGFGVQARGTAARDTVCQKCPPGTFSDEDSDVQPCKNHTDCANWITLSEGNATHNRRCVDRMTVRQPGPEMGDGVGPGAAGIYVAQLSTAGLDDQGPHVIPVKEGTLGRGARGLALLGATMLVVLLGISLSFWRRRVCTKWIVPHEVKTIHQVEICGIKLLPSTDHGLREKDPINAEAVPEGRDNGSLSEMEGPPPGLNPNGTELVQADGGGGWAEPTLQSQPSNHIENIYILRADTVIVGTVSEVPSGKTREGEENAKEGREIEPAAHYPEQETEFLPRSNVTNPVEEEWEFQYSMEKTLAI